MRNAAIIAFALTTLGLTTACEDVGNDYSEVLPDERIQINMPVESSAAKSSLDREWSEYYLLTAQVTEDVNGLIGGVLYIVDTITSEYPPTTVDRESATATWGPWADALDPVETQLWVSHDVETDIHTWGIDQWPKGLSAEDGLTVIAGEVDAGATRDVNTGRFSVDFTAINELDPTEGARGSFHVEYDLQPGDAVTATAWFDGFGEGDESINAIYTYDQTADGAGSMDLGAQADMDGGPATELMQIFSRWTVDGAGRADVRASGGDLGAAGATLSECWSEQFEAVYYVDSFGGEAGDSALCAFQDDQTPL